MNTTALVLIDIQNDYLPGGAFELTNAQAAAQNAKAALEAARKAGMTVVHVQHENVRPGATFFLPGTPGMDIHPLVAPFPGEAVVLKHFPNSFRETNLGQLLQETGAKHLVLAGMMTLMCVDATARQAADLGYGVTVLHDACAARNLVFEGVEVEADKVHAAFLAALGMGYARVICAHDFVKELAA